MQSHSILTHFQFRSFKIFLLISLAFLFIKSLTISFLFSLHICIFTDQAQLGTPFLSLFTLLYSRSIDFRHSFIQLKARSFKIFKSLIELTFRCSQIIPLIHLIRVRCKLRIMVNYHQVVLILYQMIQII